MRTEREGMEEEEVCFGGDAEINTRLGHGSIQSREEQ